MTAAIRADRTTAVSGRSASLAIRDSCGGLRRDRFHCGEAIRGAAGSVGQSTEPGTDRDDRVDVRGVLQHPQRARRRMVGNAVLPCGFQQLFDESARIVDVGRGGAQPDGAERIGGRPHGRPQRVFGIAKLVMVQSGRPGQRVHGPGQRTQFRQGGLVLLLVEIVIGEFGDQADRGGGVVWVGDDDGLTRGQGIALELRSRGQPAHVARHRQNHVDRSAQPTGTVGRRRRPAHRRAQYLQQRDGPGVVHIGPRQPGVACGDGIIRGDRLLWRPDG